MLQRLATRAIGRLVDRALTTAQREAVRAVIFEEAGHFLADIEWRYKQARELLDSGVPGVQSLVPRQITAEDLNLKRHVLTGFTLTNNSPSGGSIAWASLHIVYNGTDNAITDGNSALKYLYWVPATSATVLQSSNTKPVLGPNDVLVFLNSGGTGIVAAQDANQSLPNVVANNAIDSSAIASGAVGTSAIASGAITAGSGILATGAVTSTAIASGAVLTAGIASGAVTATQLAAGAVSAPKLNIAAHVLY